MPTIQIIPYSTQYRTVFRELNEAWIRKYFELEEEDIRSLEDPGKIPADGGYILVALMDSAARGVCALRKISGDTFEFSKLAVAEQAQGLGIGRKLVEAAIAKAAEAGAKSLYLEGNTLLEPSIHLYRKLGFKEVKVRESHYRRVNIAMELRL